MLPGQAPQGGQFYRTSSPPSIIDVVSLSSNRFSPGTTERRDNPESGVFDAN